MGAGVVAVEDPGCEEDRDDPAIGVRGFLLVTEIDADIKVVEGAMGGLEVVRGFDGEPDPVYEEEGEEDGDGEAEVPLENSGIVDVRGHGEEHADAGEEPGEPALAEDGRVGVLDF